MRTPLAHSLFTGAPRPVAPPAAADTRPSSSREADARRRALRRAAKRASFDALVLVVSERDAVLLVALQLATEAVGASHVIGQPVTIADLWRALAGRFEHEHRMQPRVAEAATRGFVTRCFVGADRAVALTRAGAREAWRIRREAVNP